MANTIPSVFRFTQATPATSWTIIHGLGGGNSAGNTAVVDVGIMHDGNYKKVIPKSITIVSKTEIRVDFSQPQAGFAVVII